MAKSTIFFSFIEEHPKATKALVTSGKVAGGLALGALVMAGVRMGLRESEFGTDFARAHFTRHSTPTIGYSSAYRANLQAVTDALLHPKDILNGSVMHGLTRRASDKFHVGHKY